MDEKIIGCMLEKMQVTDACSRNVDTLMKALVKQRKINRKQTITNILLAAFAWGAVTKINELSKLLVQTAKTVLEQEKVIEEMKPKKKGE